MEQKIKNEVIEKQYDDLKKGLKFRLENNVNDDWEQHYHCIDVLCEKHKARIRDIENGICRIEQLEQELKKKPKFNVGDEVYVISEDNEVERDFIESIDIDTNGIEYYTEMYSICWYENQLFSTEEQAKQQLKELQGIK